MNLGHFLSGTFYRSWAELNVRIRQFVRELGKVLIDWSYRK